MKEYLCDHVWEFHFNKVVPEYWLNLDPYWKGTSPLMHRYFHEDGSQTADPGDECEELWQGKAHVPRLAVVQGLPKLAAYSLSVTDGKRTRIMKEDLCDHVWEFHFNKVVPEYWLNLDPYWKGTSPLMHRYFHEDGSQTADPGDEVWGGHECCYSIVTSVVGEGKIREHYVRINRCWLHMLVSRKKDWSWEMSNILYCYSSVPDGHRVGGTGPLLLCLE
ncbi:F-box domain-containing protein [Citrus sinensis]|nr:F-box domain-containing protein [Citrus sinensis]